MDEPVAFDHFAQLWRLLHLIEDERVRAGLGKIEVDDRLRLASDSHSAVMASVRKLDHLKVGDGTPWERATKFGYAWGALGEVIAKGQRSAEEAFGDWMKSPGHRAILMDRRYSAFGPGVAMDAKGVFYWTVLAAAPRSVPSALALAPLNPKALKANGKRNLAAISGMAA